MRKAAALIIEKGRILIVKSKKNNSIWISPGGKYQGNESSLECLKRELNEELGVRVTAATLYKTYHESAAFDNVPLELETYFVQYDARQLLLEKL